MIVLSVQNLVKEYNGKKIFNPATFTVSYDDKIALIGNNGTGKSTILKMINKMIEPSSGLISFSNNVTIGYLSQEVIKDENNTLYEEAIDVFANLIQKEKELNDLAEQISLNPEDEALIEKYSKKETEFLNSDGYNYKYQIDYILNMFGFNKTMYDRKISTFSGGEKTRMAFAKLLLLKPNLLLLDEPTNNLDIVTIEWLENYLKSYSGALIMVSHDKSFIKGVCNRIFEIENEQLEIYNGKYDYYSKEKILRYEQKMELYKSQQKEMEKLRRFIEFYMPKPRFVSRAHDREKKLARLEKVAIDKPQVAKNRVHMDFKGNTRENKTLVDFKDLAIGYPDDKKVLISNINFTLYGRDHLTVMGTNGSGKTTFIKTILKKLNPLDGEIIEKTNLNIGYLEQNFINDSTHETLFNYFADKFPRMDNQDIYNLLGKYNFSYTDANEKFVDNLSGGEQMRLILAELSVRDYDLLILDEPTNHLDMFSKEELADSLNSYNGTLIIVSHDRDFIDKVSNKILYFYQGDAYYYEGAYQEFKDYELSKIIDRKEKEAKAEKVEEKKVEKNTQKHVSEDKIIRKVNYTAEKLVAKIDKLEAKLDELKKLCFNEEYYSSPEKMDALNKDMADIQSQLEDLYSQLYEIMN